MKKASLMVLSGFLVANAVSPALAGEIKVSRKDCLKIIRYMPAPGVAYQPGVDVHGRKVVPADLGGGASAFKVPDEITFNIGKDLAKDFNTKYTGEAVFGKVTVKRGQVFWNGQPVGDQSQNAIAEDCRKTYGNRR